MESCQEQLEIRAAANSVRAERARKILKSGRLVSTRLTIAERFLSRKSSRRYRGGQFSKPVPHAKPTHRHTRTSIVFLTRTRERGRCDGERKI